jgi:hypothetical protein
MEAQAFVEADLNKLLNTAVQFIQDSVIYRMIDDIRDWHAGFLTGAAPASRLRRTTATTSSPATAIVPNHALIILGLLYGDDDFQKSLMITNVRLGYGL